MSSIVAYCCTHFQATALSQDCLRGNVFIEPLPSSGSLNHNINVLLFSSSHYFLQISCHFDWEVSDFPHFGAEKNEDIQLSLSLFLLLNVLVHARVCVWGADVIGWTCVGIFEFPGQDNNKIMILFKPDVVINPFIQISPTKFRLSSLWLCVQIRCQTHEGQNRREKRKWAILFSAGELVFKLSDIKKFGISSKWRRIIKNQT
jgi:hypothetical protein